MSKLLDACLKLSLFTTQVFQVTLESGLGHRTVPLLLAESSFHGLAKNWSSLLQLRGDLTLEVSVEASYMGHPSQQKQLDDV